MRKSRTSRPAFCGGLFFTVLKMIWIHNVSVYLIKKLCKRYSTRIEDLRQALTPFYKKV